MVQKCEFDNIHLIFISSNSLVYFTIKYNTLWSWNFYGNYEKKVQTVIDQNIKNQEFKGFIGHQSTEIDIEINKSMLKKCILH